jgi:DNA repair protein RecO (recombination protein O)
MVLLRELGYAPVLEACAVCGKPATGEKLAFSPAAGGVLCPACAAGHRDRRPLSPRAWEALRRLSAVEEGWRELREPAVWHELRQLLGGYVTHLMGRRPKMLGYLGS